MIRMVWNRRTTGCNDKEEYVRSTEARPVLTPETAVYVAGHTGLVGSALVRALQRHGCGNLLLPTHRELDLTNQHAVDDFFTHTHPQVVFLAAARVGGIHANSTYPAEFIRANLVIQSNVIHAAYIAKVQKLLFLGSSCIYPKYALQPMREDFLLTGELEPTNKPYAVAKIAGITMCQAYNHQYGTNFICVMPTNLYGQGDNYHQEDSHVLPALIRRFHEAKVANDPEVSIWGTGRPLREFLYVDDLADACVFLMDNYSGSEIVNVGSGIEVSIKVLAETVASVIGYTGGIRFDPTKPDGTHRKLLDCSKIHALSWTHRVGLEEGISLAYKEFCSRVD